MSDKITQAREFLTSFLNRNNFPLAEHSAVLALVDYLEENGSSVTVTETAEYKELQEKLSAESLLSQNITEQFKTVKEENTLYLKQRDHNWNELTKANTKIGVLEGQVAKYEVDLLAAKAVPQNVPDVKETPVIDSQTKTPKMK